jgi:ankyrin repeat protein
VRALEMGHPLSGMASAHLSATRAIPAMRLVVGLGVLFAACVPPVHAQQYIPDPEAYRERLEREWRERQQAEEWMRHSEQLRAEERRRDQLDAARDAAQNLVVLVEGEFGETPTVGAGIVFARDGDSLYVLTANHVVRRGAASVQNLHVLLRLRPDEAVPARLLDSLDPARDAAVLRVDALREKGVDVCKLKFDTMAGGAGVKRGNPVYPIGNPEGGRWEVPVVPDVVTSAEGPDVRFQSASVRPGHSGGALLDENMALIGMITKDEPPYGVATDLATLLSLAKEWGCPVTLHVPPRGGGTLLDSAIERGDLVTIEAMLKDRCLDVSGTNALGQTPLMVASFCGNANAARLLLRAGADVNAVWGTWTPLMAAVKDNRLEVLEVLLQTGRVEPTSVRDALEEAVKNGNGRVIAMLLRNAPAAVADEMRAGTFIGTAVSEGQAESVKALVGAGANVKGGDENGATWLHKAAFRGDVPTMKTLKQAGADASARNKRDETVLGYAVMSKSAEAVEYLLSVGVDVNAVDDGRNSALHYAAALDLPTVIRVLLAAGAAVNARNMKGNTPLHEAVNAYAGDDDGGIPTHFESGGDPVAAVKALLAGGARTDLENERGETAGSIAAGIASAHPEMRYPQQIARLLAPSARRR